MSKFLAPIHSWLFNKIRIQENLERKLYDMAGDEVKAQAEEKFGPMTADGPLENQIDTSNIHGWLQERIGGTERRTAFTVKSLLDGGVTIEEIGEAFRAVGEETGRELGGSISSAEEAYKMVNDTMLSGMPCDMVNRVVSQDGAEVIYECARDIHGDNVSMAGLDPSVYLDLRDQFLKGLLSGAGYSADVTSMNPRTYRIYR